MLLFRKLSGAALALAFAFGAAATVPASAAAVSIVVNGQGISFDQPPIERAGRVFVPLRGVFERLGASVAYAGGQINAQGNGRSIALHIGSRQAIVNGQPTYMDVAPFLVGARTLIPLRFVAQALGATVNWNPSNNVVAINGGGGSVAAPPVSNPPANASFRLENVRPARGGSVSSLHPQISATFSEPVNRDSLRIYVNGNDVSSSAYANSAGTGVYVSDPNALNVGSNTVRITGTTVAGSAFDRSWRFTAGNNAPANDIRDISPANGTQVGGNFTLSGTTRPGASVHVVGQASATAFGIFPIATGSYDQSTSADGAGQFSLPVSLNVVSGGHVRLIVTSTYNGVVATRTLDYTS